MGTGPYELMEHRVGEVAILKRRAEPYWGGEVYLDEIHYLDKGEDAAAAVAALISNQVEAIYRLDLEALDLAERAPGAVISEAPTATTGCIRFKVTEPPFDDIRVRQAIQFCSDNAQSLEVANRGLGTLGYHHHVAEIHPEYFALPPLERDVEKAKALLAEAEATLDVVERTAKMEKVEKILQGDAVMVQPFFRSMLSMASEKVQNYQTHPTLYHQFNDVWLKS